MENHEIKKKILEINSMSIPQIEKSKMIFHLMNPNINNFIDTSEKSKRMFCKHSKIHLHQIFKCCNKVYPCRFCHDEDQEHEAKRFDIDYVKCDFCNVSQKKDSACNNPECYQFEKKHNYYCHKCNIWKNDSDINLQYLNSILIQKINVNKKFFHCNKCGICRVGNSDDYKHCDSCNLCIKKNIFDQHVCKIDVKDKNCPICFEKIWSHSENPHILKCGHAMHYSCFVNTINNHNYYCSICRKSIIDLKPLWSQIDDYMNIQEMPDEYKDWTTFIRCRECNTESTVKYHFEYHKCLNLECGCYNTDILKLNKN